MSEQLIDLEEIARKKREKENRLAGLVDFMGPGSGSSTGASSREELEVEHRASVSVNDRRTTYQIRLKDSDREWVKNFAYTRSQQLGRQVTYQQVIDEALESLRQNSKFNILIKPSSK